MKLDEKLILNVVLALALFEVAKRLFLNDLFDEIGKKSSFERSI